jgi:hypothetical protein
MNSPNPSGDRVEGPLNKAEPGTATDKEKQPPVQREIGGPPGPEPTRYGDWEKGGRCIDF